MSATSKQTKKQPQREVWAVKVQNTKDPYYVSKTYFVYAASAAIAEQRGMLAAKDDSGQWPAHPHLVVIECKFNCYVH